MKRTAFFISDGTGITAEALGNSLLAQFESIQFEKITLPYIDTPEKAHEAVQQINKAASLDDGRPIAFDTIVDRDVREVLSLSDAFLVDIFGTFLSPLEEELKSSSSYTVGKSHSITKDGSYEQRIKAVNYALENDDGARTRYYDDADVILVGPSRSGKTPTCLYLALQYGIKAANYPLTEEDLEDQRLPRVLQPYRGKIFGLTIDPERLSAIRNERRPGSGYASLRQCMLEINEAESMYRRERVPFLNTTDYSVEEISTRIIIQTGVERRAR